MMGKSSRRMSAEQAKGKSQPLVSRHNSPRSNWTLRALIQASIDSLSSLEGASEKSEAAEKSEKAEERWIDADERTLLLVFEDELWNVYTGPNLEMAFETYAEAKAYLREEGFSRL